MTDPAALAAAGEPAAKHAELYAAPFLYDLAFSYRDYAAECDFLEELYARAPGRAPRSFLEIAAGPARHAVEFACRGLRGGALDLSPEMVAYGLARAGERGAALDYRCGDM